MTVVLKLRASSAHTAEYTNHTVLRLESAYQCCFRRAEIASKRLGQTRFDIHILSVIVSGTDIRITRIAHKERFAHVDIIPVVIRQILQLKAIGKSDVQAVSESKAQGIEIIYRNFDVYAAEFSLVTFINGINSSFLRA